jgi:hypothetical protein
MVFLEFWRLRAETMWRSHVSVTPRETGEEPVGDGTAAPDNGVGAGTSGPWGVGSVQSGVEAGTAGPSRRRVAER